MGSLEQGLLKNGSLRKAARLYFDIETLLHTFYLSAETESIASHVLWTTAHRNMIDHGAQSVTGTSARARIFALVT